jgi:flagellar FliJ protein
MPKFRFKLEPVLEARRRAEQEKQRRVAELERQRRELEDTLRRHQQFIASGKQSLATQLVGSLQLDSLRGHASSTIQLMRRAHRVLLELAGVHKRLESARAELIGATRDRRAVELLRERRFAEWKRKLERAENAALDELAVQSAGARRRSNRFSEEPER